MQIVIIGRTLVNVRLVVDAVVRRLVTFMLNRCLGQVWVNVLSLAGFSTVVATVMILVCLCLTVINLLENVFA